MADRGRKAFPVSSHLCDEKWQRHCMDLHKQRLTEMKGRIDNKQPETFEMVLSKGKRLMLEKERQTEVDRENAILLQKMVRIKEQDTRAVFRPWTARSTFQWKLGHYYDPATGTKTLDHINLTSSVSPRSIHYFALSRPGTAPPDVTARLRDMEIQADNTKLLRTITTMRSKYSVDAFEKRHAEESVLLNRISNYRGPESAKYQPPGRRFAQSMPGRSASTGRPLRSAPASMQQYYEDAQMRDLPPPSSSQNGSRPGTAVAPQRSQGLGETSPRQSASSRHSSQRPSRPESAADRPGSATGAAASFSFAAKPEPEAAEEPAGADHGDGGSAGQWDAEEPEREEPQQEQARASASGHDEGAGDEEARNSYDDEGFDAADEYDAEEGGGAEEGDRHDPEAEQERQEEEEEPTHAHAAEGEEEPDNDRRESRTAGYDAHEQEQEEEQEEARASASGHEEGAGDEHGSDHGPDFDGAQAGHADEGDAEPADPEPKEHEAEAESQPSRGDVGGYDDDEGAEPHAAEEKPQDEEEPEPEAAPQGDEYEAEDDGEPDAVDEAAKSYAGDTYASSHSTLPRVGGFAADWD